MPLDRNLSELCHSRHRDIQTESGSARKNINVFYGTTRSLTTFIRDPQCHSLMTDSVFEGTSCYRIQKSGPCPAMDLNGAEEKNPRHDKLGCHVTALNMETVCLSETSVSTYECTRCLNPEEQQSHDMSQKCCTVHINKFWLCSFLHYKSTLLYIYLYHKSLSKLFRCLQYMSCFTN
jgi:hypothetical protein